MTTSRLWSIPSDSGLRWRSWDAEFVVHHPASGAIHILNVFEGEVLVRLSEPTTLEQLHGRLLEDLGLGKDEIPRSRLASALQVLEKAGLIRCHTE